MSAWKHQNLWLAAVAALLLTACNPFLTEEQGNQVLPSSQLNIRANILERSQGVTNVAFLPKSDMLDVNAPNVDALPATIDMAEQVWIFGPKVDAMRGARVLALTRVLRSQGVASTKISSDVLESLEQDRYRLEYTISSVRLPSCPNWGDSATGSFSNKPFSNMGCANVNNIGQMAADPRDLMGNAVTPRIDSTNAVRAIETYHGTGAAATGAPAPTGGASGGEDSGASTGASASAGK